MAENSTQTRILDTAAHLFGEYGQAAVSTARIASEARANKAMIFYYFGSKDGLYLAAVQQLVGGLSSAVEDRLKGVEPGIPLIEAFVRAHIGYLIERPSFVKLMVRELLARENDPPTPVIELMKTMGGLRDRVIESIEIAVQRGELRRVDPIHTFLNIVSMNVFTFVGKPIIDLIFSETDIDRLIRGRADHVLDLLMNGLKPKRE